MFTTHDNSFDILDTIKATNKGFTYKKLHALRTFEAYQMYYKTFSLDQVLDTYNVMEKEVLKSFTTDLVVRSLFLKSELKYTFTTNDYVALKSAVKLQIIRELRQPSGLGRQNFKWNDRTYWNQVLKLKSTSTDDVISLNEKNQPVETSRFNLFFYDGSSNEVFTPSLSTGCVNGVFRRFAFQQGFVQLPEIGIKKLRETDIFIDTIKNYQLFVANSVRGLVPAELVS